MKIGIVNAGNIGQNLALSWIRHGHDILLSKDTSPEQLQERIRELGSSRGLAETELAKFKYGSLVEAAEFGDVIIFSIYFPRLGHLLKEFQRFGLTLSGKIIIDTMNPLNVDENFNHYHDMEYMHRTSITEEIQKVFPEAIVFKAFNTIPATLLDVSKWTSGRVPPVLFVGGSSKSVDTARKLITDAGFLPKYAGCNLGDSGLLERLGVLSHRLAENEFQGDANIAFDVFQSKA